MLGLIGGLLRAADGKDLIPMFVFVVAVGFIFGISTLSSSITPWYYHFPLCIAGVLVWKAAPWGNYFSAFHSQWNKQRADVKWIDWIGYKLVPFESFEHPTNRKRGLICMAIRGAAYSLPLFIYLGISVHWLGFLLWIFMAMQGAFYWAAYWVTNANENGIRVTFAEILTVWFMIDLVEIIALVAA